MDQYQLLHRFCGRRCFLCTSEQQPRAFVAVLVRGARRARSCAYPRQTAASRPQGVPLLRGCRKQRQRGCLGATRKEDNLTQRRLGMGAGAQAPVGGDGFRDLAVQVVRRLFGRLGHHCPPLPRRKSVGNGLPQRRYRRVPDTKSDEECAARQGKCRVHCQCVAPDSMLRASPCSKEMSHTGYAGRSPRPEIAGKSKHNTPRCRCDSGRSLRSISRALLGSLRSKGRRAARLVRARVGGLVRDCGEYGGHFTDQRVLERSAFCRCRAKTGGMAVRVPHLPSRSPHPRRWGAAAHPPSGRLARGGSTATAARPPFLGSGIRRRDTSTCTLRTCSEREHRGPSSPRQSRPVWPCTCRTWRLSGLEIQSFDRRWSRT